MKYSIKIYPIALAFIFGVTFFVCKTKTAEIHKEAPTKPQSLRLTYDSTWSPNTDFVVKESGSIHNSGNTYLIEYDSNAAPFKSLRLFSTNQENRLSFSYLQAIDLDKAKVFYLPWRGNKISVIVQANESDPERIYCRWEGIYKGYLLVIETNNLDKLRKDFSTIAQNLHTLVTDSLKLY